MKKRTVLSILLALTLISSTLLLSASALTMGDVDGDGGIKAADARLALRASVGLENLDEDQKKAADVDYDGAIKAADARMILRASVGLEEIEIKGKTFNGHPVENDCITMEKGIVCSDPDCCGETLVPSFNELVNALKEPGSLNYYYGFTKNVTKTPKPECKPSSIIHLGLAEMMESLLADSIAPGEVVEYTDFTNGRHVNNATFFVTGKEYVSALTDKDVKSVTMEKMSGLDFVKTLPNSYKSTDSGETYDLSAYKTALVGDVYKVTVTLNTEEVTNKNMPDSVTPIEKIISSDYNKGIKDNMTSLNSAFSEVPEMEGMIGMEMEIKTDCEVIYYFTADTFEPVACVYNVNMATVSLMHTYFDNLFIKKDKPTTTLTIESVAEQENYYFFNDFFKK